MAKSKVFSLEAAADLTWLTYRVAGHVCGNGKAVVFKLEDAAAKLRRKTKTEVL